MVPFSLITQMLPTILGSYFSSVADSAGKGLGSSAHGTLGTLLSTGLAGSLGGLLEGVGAGKGLRSVMAGITNAELTGAQREQNQFNSEEAEKARQFSEMQRQTQYQTAVSDMQAAGLNPAMMYQGAGQAASPTASPQASGNGSPSGNRIADLVSMLPALAQLKQVEAETKKTEAEANFIDIQSDEMPKLWQSTRALNEAQVDNLLQAMEESKSRVLLNGKEMDVKDAQIAVYGSEVSLNEAREAEANAKAWLDNMSAEQVRQLTPVLVQLNRANTMLAQQQALTEGEKRLYLRAQTRCQEALYDVYIAQRENIVADTHLKGAQTANVAADTALKGASLPGVKADSAMKTYGEFEMRNYVRATRGGGMAANYYLSNFNQMVGAASSLIGGIGSLRSGTAQSVRNGYMGDYFNTMTEAAKYNLDKRIQIDTRPQIGFGF